MYYSTFKLDRRATERSISVLRIAHVLRITDLHNTCAQFVHLRWCRKYIQKNDCVLMLNTPFYVFVLSHQQSVHAQSTIQCIENV